jgi:hypothetical protein
LESTSEYRPRLEFGKALTARFKGQHATSGLDCVVPASFANPGLQDPAGVDRLAAVVGDAITFANEIPDCAGTFTLLRSPPAVNASPTPRRLDGGQLAINRPGLYVVRCTLSGGWHRDIAVAAFSPKALEKLQLHYEMRLQRRKRLRSIVADPRVTPETIVAALEGEGNGSEGISPALLGGASMCVAHYGC